MENNILIVLTSHGQMGRSNNKTGVWLGEFTDPYYAFLDASYYVTIASPLGGEPPVDPMSKLTKHITESNKRFLKDDLSQKSFANTLRLENLHASAFDAVFIAGGHGPLWDLANNEPLGDLLLDFFNNKKPIGAVCHGPAALLQMERMAPGFLMGKAVTSFTDVEEELVMRSKHIPFKLESKLKEHGANFSSSTIPFTSNVVTDGLVVTGQNPLSAHSTALALLELVKVSKAMNVNV